MAVAFDAFSEVGTGTGNTSGTHTPTGTPRGIILLIFRDAASDDITAASYGGVAMTEVTGSPLLKATGETMGVYGYFLGSSIPTGAQTVTTTSAGGGVGRRVYCISLTADADTEVQDTDVTITSDSLENPSATLSLGGKTCFCCQIFGSGQADVTSITPLTDWTARAEEDFGAKVYGCYTYDTIGSTDVTMGWTQTADDALAIGVAVTEVSSPKGLIMLMGDGGFL